MSNIAVRLRVPLRFYTREQQTARALYGIELPPALIVPARSTLRIVEWFEEAVAALTPGGERVVISRATLREHGYPPRSSTTVAP